MGSHKKSKHQHKDKKRKKEKKKKKDKKDKKLKKLKTTSETIITSATTNNSTKNTEVIENTYDIPLPPGFQVEEPTTPKLPMTKEQYESKAKEIRKVLDPETGRYRLIRGEGEIIEEIVSKDRHKEINKQATRGDGESFERSLYTSIKK